MKHDNDLNSAIVLDAAGENLWRECVDELVPAVYARDEGALTPEQIVALQMDAAEHARTGNVTSRIALFDPRTKH